MSDKIKFQLEYEIKSSPRILYNFISETNELEQWFADKVTVQGNEYTFEWDDENIRAEIVMMKENKLVRFRNIDDDSKYFFEMEIIQDEITNDIALSITDFALPENIEERKLIWDAQVQILHSVIGG